MKELVSNCTANSDTRRNMKSAKRVHYMYFVEITDKVVLKLSAEHYIRHSTDRSSFETPVMKQNISVIYLTKVLVCNVSVEFCKVAYVVGSVALSRS